MNPEVKYYGFPYYLTEMRDSLAIRQDWLDKLGLKTPTTVDEFYEVAKAFATRIRMATGKPIRRVSRSGLSITVYRYCPDFGSIRLRQ